MGESRRKAFAAAQEAMRGKPIAGRSPMPGQKRTPHQITLDTATLFRLLRRGWTQIEIAEELGISHQMVSHDILKALGEIKAATEEDIRAYREIKLLELGEVKKEAWAAWERSKEDAVSTTTEHGRVKVGGGKNGNGKGGSKNQSKGRGKGKKGRHGDDEEVDVRGNRSKQKVNYKEGSKKSKRGWYGRADPGERIVQGPGGPTTEPRYVFRKVKESQTVEGRCGDVRYLQIVLDCIKAEREIMGVDPPKKLNMKTTAPVLDWGIIAGALPSGPIPDEIEAEIERAVNTPLLIDGRTGKPIEGKSESAGSSGAETVGKGDVGEESEVF